MGGRFALKEILQEKCVKFSALCRKAGLSRVTLWRVIKRGGGNSKTLEKIAEALGVSVSELWREQKNDQS